MSQSFEDHLSTRETILKSAAAKEEKIIGWVLS